MTLKDPLPPECTEKGLDYPTLDAWRAGHVPGFLVNMDLLMEVEDGGLIPFGWGVAWRSPHSWTILLMPIPFNILAGWIRRAWIWMMVRGAPRGFDRLERAYLQGRREGYARGRDAGRSLGRSEANRELNDVVRTAYRMGVMKGREIVMAVVREELRN